VVRGLSAAGHGLDQLGQDGKLERLLDQGSGCPVHKFGQRRRFQITSGEDEAAEEIRAVFSQPIVQLNSRAMRHPKVGHHNLVSAGSRTPQLPERASPVLCLVGFPSPPAEIAGERRSDRRLVVDDQRPPRATSRRRSEGAGIGKDH
jgi:hypothetical protein